MITPSSDRDITSEAVKGRVEGAATMSYRNPTKSTLGIETQSPRLSCSDLNSQTTAMVEYCELHQQHIF